MGGYKEYKIFDMSKRKSIIIRYMFFIAIIFIATIVLVVQALTQKKTNEINYIENSKLDYKVYLKENDFFENEYLGPNNQYIASLIDYIQAEFKYKLEAVKSKSIDYKYTYKIVAETQVQDRITKNLLYNISENLVEEKEYNANTDSEVIIKKSIRIDYSKFNKIINDFIDLYDLEDSIAKLNINMYVEVIDEETENKNIKPVVSLSIPLTTKTIAIDIESNSVNNNDVNIYKTINMKKYLFISVLLILLDSVLIGSLLNFIKDTKNEKSVYNMRLKQIMFNYGSYIQKLNNEFDFDEYQILEIKSFEDLLQVRETISRPILMTEKELAMETFFFIPTEKSVYIYELKAGNIRKNRGKRYKEKEKREEEIV